MALFLFVYLARPGQRQYYVAIISVILVVTTQGEGPTPLPPSFPSTTTMVGGDDTKSAHILEMSNASLLDNNNGEREGS